MHRAQLLALFASAISEPWAVRREWMDALSAAALATARGGADLASPAGVRREIAAPAALTVTYVSGATDQSAPQSPPGKPKEGEDGAAELEDDDEDDDQIEEVDSDNAHPDQSAPDDDETDDEYHPDPNSAALAPRAAIHPNTTRATARKPGSVAVIPVNGTISPKGSIWDWIFGTTPCTPANIAQAVTDAANDESVKAIVLNFDSGGGSVVGITEAWSAIFEVRGKKPIVAQIVGNCCSAAYWLASACDEIAATESATVGAIGVYCSHDDVSAALAQIGVKRTYVQAGAYKTEGAPEEPLSEEARAHMQEYVDDFMGYFAADVAKGRGVPEATVRGEPYGQGRSYIASRAQKRGLVDKVRSLEDTLAGFGVGQADASKPAKGRPLALARREIDALTV